MARRPTVVSNSLLPRVTVLATSLIVSAAASWVAAAPAHADEAPVSGSYFAAPNVEPFEPDEMVYADFDDGMVAVQSTCNTLTGSTTWDDGKLTVGPLASTLMACDDDAMAEDEWLSKWLSAPLSYVMDGEQITLSDGTTSMTFERNLLMEATGAPSLKRTSWSLRRYGRAGSSLQSVAPRQAPWLRIKATSVRFHTGCNLGFGPAVVSSNRLKLAAVGMTRVGCSGVAAQVEQRMVATLQGTVTARQRGERLTLRHGDNVLVFARA